MTQTRSDATIARERQGIDAAVDEGFQDVISMYEGLVRGYAPAAFDSAKAEPAKAVFTLADQETLKIEVSDSFLQAAF